MGWTMCWMKILTTTRRCHVPTLTCPHINSDGAPNPIAVVFRIRDEYQNAFVSRDSLDRLPFSIGHGNALLTSTGAT